MNSETFIEALLQGNFHRGGVRCWHLFTVPADFLQRLQTEIAHLQLNSQVSTVSDPNHVTHWVGAEGEVQQLSLYNTSGRTDDFSSDHDLSCRGKWFFQAMRYPALDTLIAAFPHLINVRVNILPPGAALAAHEEHIPFLTEQQTVGARLRFHLPIFSSNEAELNLDGQVFCLPPGAIYLVNQGCVHAAVNNGPTPRVHLVWDALLTQQLYHFLFEASPAPSFMERCVCHEVEPVRLEPIGAFRRMPPSLSESQALNMTLCRPQ